VILVTVALAGVLAAAFCSGTAAVLQAAAVRRLPTAGGLRPGFAAGLLRSPRYLIALLLVAAGFGLSVLALRTLPLFVVQAGRASSLAVTAVLAVLILRARLRPPELAAIGGVVVGLVLLALSAGPQHSTDVGLVIRLTLLGAVLGAAALAAAAMRITPVARSGLALGVLAGLCFGVLAVGARILAGFAPATLITDPAAWAAGLGGVLGLMLGALALQRAAVVGVTAAMVGTEALIGAGLGMLLCGDRPLPGRGGLALLGFALVVAGAMVLARFGAPENPESSPEPEGVLPIG
jgi:drug/metabolite transporter (DMT)-like permease